MITGAAKPAEVEVEVGEGAAGNNSPKVSVLLDSLLKLNVELTFENFHQ